MTEEELNRLEDNTLFEYINLVYTLMDKCKSYRVEEKSGVKVTFDIKLKKTPDIEITDECIVTVDDHVFTFHLFGNTPFRHDMYEWNYVPTEETLKKWTEFRNRFIDFSTIEFNRQKEIIKANAKAEAARHRHALATDIISNLNDAKLKILNFT